VEAAAVDEMGSFVGRKAHQRWLWHAIDHLSGVVLAYAVGSRADTVCVELKRVLKPFGLEHFYTDAAGVYERPLPIAAHTVGKRNTQQIERNISPSGRGASAWHGKPFVSPNRSSCLTP
jgi:insertion element IS1 protein InsB